MPSFVTEIPLNLKLIIVYFVKYLHVECVKRYRLCYSWQKAQMFLDK